MSHRLLLLGGNAEAAQHMQCRWAQRADGSLVAFIPPVGHSDFGEKDFCIAQFQPSTASRANPAPWYQKLPLQPGDAVIAHLGTDFGGDAAWRPNDEGIAPFGMRRPYKAYDQSQNFMRCPRCKRVAKRRDPMSPNHGSEFTQDGMSLIDWRYKGNNSMCGTRPLQIAQVAIEGMAGGDTTDESTVTVDGTPLSGAGEHRRTKSPIVFGIAAWAPPVAALPRGIYAYGEIDNVYVVNSQQAKLLTKWSKSEIL